MIDIGYSFDGDGVDGDGVDGDGDGVDGDSVMMMVMVMLDDGE